MLASPKVRPACRAAACAARRPRSGSATARDRTPFAEPHQREDRLPPARQRPGPGPGTAGTALVGQQPGQVGHQFGGHVEDGTIGDHVEPPGTK